MPGRSTDRKAFLARNAAKRARRRPDGHRGVRAHDGVPAGHAALRGAREREQRHRRRRRARPLVPLTGNTTSGSRDVTNVSSHQHVRTGRWSSARGSRVGRGSPAAAVTATLTIARNATATATGVALDRLRLPLSAGRPHRRPRRRRQAGHRGHGARVQRSIVGPVTGTRGSGIGVQDEQAVRRPAAVRRRQGLDVPRRGDRRASRPADDPLTPRAANVDPEPRGAGEPRRRRVRRQPVPRRRPRRQRRRPGLRHPVPHGATSR